MSSYRPATREEAVSAADQGISERDLFVFVQSTKAYMLFVKAGEEIPDDKRRNLLVLLGSNLFVEGVAKHEAAVKPAPEPQATSRLAGGKLDLGGEPAFVGENLGPKAGQVLRDAYRDLLDPAGGDKAAITETISAMSESILSVVAPEVGDVKSSVLQSLRTVHLMHHSAAITSLGVLCALANDFKSRTAFANICHAVLLMDSSLASLDEDEITAYYRNRRELPGHVMEKIQNHPHRSQQLVAGLPMVNDTINQLILVHHELHNGKGFHRGIKTANILQLGRVLAFAVDLYETLKQAELNGQSVSFVEAINRLDERGVEPHMRRHAGVVVKAVKDFLGLKA